MYHSIAEGSEDPYTVPPNKFEEQLSWLIERGCEAVSLATIVNLLKIGEYKSLRTKIVFTFDDGYKDFLTTALPILLHYKVPATVFIVAGMLGDKVSWNSHSKHAQLMSEDEIRHIKAQGVSLGSHTMTHSNLAKVDEKKVYQELVDSHITLRDLGESFYALSYPWGQWTNQVLNAVKVAGYECAVTASRKMPLGATEYYCLPRVGIKGDMNLKSFQTLFDGSAIEFARKVGRVVKNFLQ